MPVSTDTDLLIKAFKIEDKGSPIGGTVNVYVNSTRTATNIESTGGYLTTFGSVVLGTGFQPDPGRYLNGSIANFRIYRKALSASESLQNFNANRALFGI